MYNKQKGQYTSDATISATNLSLFKVVNELIYMKVLKYLWIFKIFKDFRGYNYYTLIKKQNKTKKKQEAIRPGRSVHILHSDPKLK